MQKLFNKNLNPKVELIGSYKYKLLEDITVNINPKDFNYFKDGTINVIPAGYITDGYSVPRLFWNIFPPLGKDDRCAILHDYLYELGMYTRKTCDTIFLEAMLQNKVKKWKAYTKYFFVRAFGYFNYNRKY